MDTLRKIFKDKDKPFLIRLMVLAVLGIVLLLGSNLLLRGQDKSAKEPPVPKSENSSNTMFFTLRGAAKYKINTAGKK